jgi:hypothetical protein
MKISLKQRGDFNNIEKYLKKNRGQKIVKTLERFGREGVEALSRATPVDTGLTADSWYYVINQQDSKISIEFWNSNVVNGVPIAIVLQYGHGTRNGGWVQGVDYINPALQSIFQDMATTVWREVMVNG